MILIDRHTYNFNMQKVISQGNLSMIDTYLPETPSSHTKAFLYNDKHQSARNRNIIPISSALIASSSSWSGVWSTVILKCFRNRELSTSKDIQNLLHINTLVNHCRTQYRPNSCSTEFADNLERTSWASYFINTMTTSQDIPVSELDVQSSGQAIQVHLHSNNTHAVMDVLVQSNSAF